MSASTPSGRATFTVAVPYPTPEMANHGVRPGDRLVIREGHVEGVVIVRAIPITLATVFIGLARGDAECIQGTAAPSLDQWKGQPQPKRPRRAHLTLLKSEKVS